jgi:hypothetical protein
VSSSPTRGSSRRSDLPQSGIWGLGPIVALTSAMDARTQLRRPPRSWKPGEGPNPLPGPRAPMLLEKLGTLDCGGECSSARDRKPGHRGVGLDQPGYTWVTAAPLS